jgi:predicted Zn-dependent protease
MHVLLRISYAHATRDPTQKRSIRESRKKALKGQARKPRNLELVTVVPNNTMKTMTRTKKTLLI